MRCRNSRGTSAFSFPSRSLLAFSLMTSMVAILVVAGCGGSKAEDQVGRKEYEAAGDDSQPNNDANNTPQPFNPLANSGGNDGGPVGGQDGGPAPAKPTAIPGADLTDLEPPADATPAKLLEFAKGLLRQPSLPPMPPTATQADQQRALQEVLANSTKEWNAAIAAADKALGNDLKPEQRLEAIEIKISAYMNLAGFRVEGAGVALRQFCTGLLNDKDTRIAGQGRIVLFGLRIRDLMTGKEDNFKKFAGEVREFVKSGKLAANPELEEQVFLYSQQAVMALKRFNQIDLAQDLSLEIGQRFAGSDNKKIAGGAKDLLDQNVLIEIGFVQKQYAAIQGQPGALPKFMEAVEKLLAVKKPGELLFDRLLDAAQMMEATQQFKESKVIVDGIEKSFAGTADEKLADRAKQNVASARRRLALPGSTFTVEGVHLNGRKFDWKQYEGKVVLLDFWATWCEPCLEEIPNIEKAYEKYRDKGFEVIGVNLDDDPATAKRFLQQKFLPWTTIVSSDPEKPGFRNPMAEKCGVAAIPFLVLVGKDGRVVTLHPRGPELEKQLAKLLGDSAAAPTKKTSQVAPRQEEFFFVAAQEKAAEEKSDATAADKKAADKKDGEEEDPVAKLKLDEINPYLADKSLKPGDLVEYIFRMQDKPKSIRERPGFHAAMVDAAERLMKADTKDRFKLMGAMTKFEVLHHQASYGHDEADKLLVKFVGEMAQDKRPKVKKEVEFLTLERRVLDVDKLDLKKVPELLKEVQAYLAKQELEARHLRIASAAVHAINRLKDGDAREKQFGEFGKIFAKSKAKELASYGRRLAKTPGGAPSKLVGKPLELEGFTTLGEAFDWKAYRGKVVLVDFWATWCGPCRREMPHVKALYQELKKQGFEVVAVSLDKDLDALGRYIDENKIAWTNLAGQETQGLARKYGVTGIPTMMLVDQEGKMIDVAHNVKKLAPQARALLGQLGKEKEKSKEKSK